MQGYKREKKEESIKDLIEKIELKIEKNKIELNPTYQRDVVWDNEKMSGFIDSLMKNIVPNNIIFNISNNKWVCMDGKQRLSSILKFYNNEIPWIVESNDASDDVADDDEPIYYYYSSVPVDRRKLPNYRILSKELKDKFLNGTIDTTIYKDLTYVQETDIFNRIQNSVVSTSGERLFSMFKNREVAIKLKEFMTKHNHMKVTRCKHGDRILDIMYMTYYNKYQMMNNKKDKEKFIKAIDDNIVVDKLIKKLDNNLEIYLSKKLLRHADLASCKISKIILINMFYLINSNKELSTMTPDQLQKIRNVYVNLWNDWNSEIDKDKNKQTNTVLLKLQKKFNEFYSELFVDDEINLELENIEIDKIDNVDKIANPARKYIVKSKTSTAIVKRQIVKRVVKND